MEPLVFHWKMMCGLRRFNDQAEKLAQPFCERHELTPQQLRVLMSLSVAGPMPVSRLAETTCMAGANTSNLCKKLACRQLVSRQRDEADERQVLVALLPEGQRLVQEFSEECAHRQDEVLSQLSPEDLEVITAGLDRMMTILDNKEILL